MCSQDANTKKRLDHGLNTVLVSLATNILLAAIKIFAGILGNSYALLADGIESTLDIFSSIVVLGGITLSTKPADENHPYGHGKAESLSAVFVSLVIILAGFGIAAKSILELNQPHDTPEHFTLVVLIGVIAIKETLFRFIFSIGKSVNSLSLKTEAWHQRSDALTSIAAFIGISIAVIGGRAYANADDWAALVASGIIILNGIIMLRQANREIMDYAPNPETEETIRSIAGRVPGVSAIEKCRARKSGIQLFVDLHVEVDGNMKVADAHKIGHDVKDALMKDPALGIADVLVHIEPSKATRNY